MAMATPWHGQAMVSISFGTGQAMVWLWSGYGLVINKSKSNQCSRECEHGQKICQCSVRVGSQNQLPIVESVHTSNGIILHLCNNPDLEGKHTGTQAPPFPSTVDVLSCHHVFLHKVPVYLLTFLAIHPATHPATHLATYQPTYLPNVAPKLPSYLAP